MRDARAPSDSGNEFPDHMTVHVGEAEIAAGMTEGQLLVVEPEQGKIVA
jgi:hypothetical protein